MGGPPIAPTHLMCAGEEVPLGIEQEVGTRSHRQLDLIPADQGWPQSTPLLCVLLSN